MKAALINKGPGQTTTGNQYQQYLVSFILPNSLSTFMFETLVISIII